MELSSIEIVRMFTMSVRTSLHLVKLHLYFQPNIHTFAAEHMPQVCVSISLSGNMSIIIIMCSLSEASFSLLALNSESSGTYCRNNVVSFPVCLQHEGKLPIIHFLLSF